MAEDMGDKTEAATPRRREEAREQGQVAKSADLTAAALLLGFLLLMNSFGEGLLKALRIMMESFLSADAFSDLHTRGIGMMIGRAIAAAGMAVMPLLLGGFIIAVVMNLVQVGLFFNPQRLMPNFGILNPGRGFGRLFSGEGIVHLVLNLLKLGLVLSVAWSAIKGRFDQVLHAQQLDCAAAFKLGAGIVYSIGMRIALLLLVLALLDYAYQRYKHEQEMKMTKQEIKEEMRRMEGDPKIKQRRRQIAMQMLAKKLKKDVPTADVVVTNPTHFAIAIKYEAATMHAPRVVAKGADLMAKRIREIAIEAGVPILERKPLAQALYKLCDVGDEIPEQFYSAIAEILAYVYELTGKIRRKQAV
jgi:flagellar biosynthetic protein FlhB